MSDETTGDPSPYPRLPLPMVTPGTEMCVECVCGRGRDIRFLESLGFVCGSRVCILSELGENLIVRVKETRMAIGKSLALKILVRVCAQEQDSLPHP